MSVEIEEYLISIFLILEIKYPKSMEVYPKYKKNQLKAYKIYAIADSCLRKLFDELVNFKLGLTSATRVLHCKEENL